MNNFRKMHLQLSRIYPLQHHQPTLLVPQQVMLNDSHMMNPLNHFMIQIMQSWMKLVCLIIIVTMVMMTLIPLMYLKVSTHPKLNVCIPSHLMEQNADILTWNKKTGEIVFHNQNVRDSNIIKLLKDMFTANLHLVGKMEFYRGLDLLKVKLTCVKHPRNKALLTIMKGEKKIVNKKNNGGGRKMKYVKKNKNWISWM